MPPNILPQAVASACRTRHDRLMVQIPPNVGGQLGRRAVAASAILLQRLHRDPVEIAAQQAHQLPGLGAARFRGRGRGIAIRADLGARSRRFLLAQLAQQLVERLLLLAAWLQTAAIRSAARRERLPASRRRCACRCPAKSGSACSGLMYPGVPTNCPICVKMLSPASLRRGRLGQPEVDDPRHWFAVHFDHQNVGRFQDRDG